MTAARLYRLAQSLGLGYEANIIFTSQSKPARRLRGLVTLAQRGHDIRIGNTIDQLRIDGVCHPWRVLETVK